MKKNISKFFLIFSLVSALSFITGCTAKIEEASLTGTVILDESTDQNAGFLVSIAGTGFQATTSSSGKFLIENIPVEPVYEIIVIKGNFMKTWKSDVKLTAFEKYDLGTLNLTTQEITDNTDKSDATVSYDDKNFYVTATDSGINFKYNFLSNGRDPQGLNMTVKELDSGITMKSYYEKDSYTFGGLDATYPFVTKGKTYNFFVWIYLTNSTVYEENVSVTAKGGLGEYKITNADAIKTKFDSETKVISRSAEPVFTENSNVVIVDQGCRYYIERKPEETPEFDDNSWIADYFNNDPFSTNHFDMKNINSYYFWRNYEDVDRILSGHKCNILTETYIYVSGYLSQDTLFYMNDEEYITGNWGGEPVKAAVVYGVNGKYTKEELDGYTGLPGTSVTFDINGTETTFPFVEYHYFGEKKYEPVFELKYNGNKVNYYWGTDDSHYSYPISVSPNIKAELDGKTILIHKLPLTTK